MENIKWVRLVVWAIIGALLVSFAATLYIMARMVILGFQLGGSPPQDAAQQFTSGAGIITAILVVAALGGFLAGRGAARRAEGSYLLNGILAGVLVVVLSVIWSAATGGLGWFTLAVVAVVLAFAVFGGWVGGRAAQAEEYD